MSRSSTHRLVRPLVQKLDPYVPGEQPRIQGLIKLNTNENPYPPSPKVLAATKAAVDGRLRLYPNPTAQALRERLARWHRCRPENIIVGNGSDELLAMAVRCFVEPAAARGRRSSSVAQFFEPSYSLYPVLADIHGALTNAVRLRPDFDLPSVAELKRGRQWDFGAALTLVTTPNAPSGRGYTRAQLASLCRAQRGVVVLDEAYVDFARENALALALRYPNVLVARTFSKAYSLCFQRVGYFVGPRELIGALHKIRDSYNVNGLGQVAALATLGDLPYYRANFRQIIATRERLSRQLAGLGFQVLPSQTNFIMVRPPMLENPKSEIRNPKQIRSRKSDQNFPAREWLEKLRTRKILVRWFKDPLVSDYLRITIGTPQEAESLVRAVRGILDGV